MRWRVWAVGVAVPRQPPKLPADTPPYPPLALPKWCLKPVQCSPLQRDPPAGSAWSPAVPGTQETPGPPCLGLFSQHQSLYWNLPKVWSSPKESSSSPPKSILKHSDHTSPCDTVAASSSSYSRSTSPPKSILKHTEFSPDTKQTDAPPRSILKPGSLDSDGDELEESSGGGYRPKKSILKSRSTDSGGSDPDSGPNSRVTSPSRSILKNMQTGQAALKWMIYQRLFWSRSPGDHRDSPRSILKKSCEFTEPPRDIDMGTSPPQSILKKGSPTREPVQPTAKVKPRSILKSGPFKTEGDEAESSPAPKTTWSPALVKAKKSSGSPTVSASFSEGKLASDSTGGVTNNFSAFNMNDSISLVDSSSDSSGKPPKGKPPNRPRGKWRPMPAKEPLLKTPNQTLPAKRLKDNSQAPKPLPLRGPPRQRPSLIGRWRRRGGRQSRGGKYEDPEKKHLLVNNEKKTSEPTAGGGLGCESRCKENQSEWPCTWNQQEC